jgi:hypothetical protein
MRPSCCSFFCRLQWKVVGGSKLLLVPFSGLVLGAAGVSYGTYRVSRAWTGSSLGVDFEEAGSVSEEHIDSGNDEKEQRTMMSLAGSSTEFCGFALLFFVILRPSDLPSGVHDCWRGCRGRLLVGPSFELSSVALQ